MNTVLKKILGDPQARTIKRLRKRVRAINDLGDKYKKLSDEQLKEQTDVLKKRLKSEGYSIDHITGQGLTKQLNGLMREASARMAAG